MNILFYSFFDVSPQKGGTERITSTLAGYFQNVYKHNCYLAYSKNIDEGLDKATFTDRIRISNYSNNSISKLVKFIRDKNINIVIIQGAFEIVKPLKIQLKGINIHVVFAHHYQPGWEENFYTPYKNIIPRILNREEQPLKGFIKLLAYPILRQRYINSLKSNYRNTYIYADRVVLLSNGFVEEYQRYANLEENDKFHIIHNALSYDTFLTEDEYKNKEKKIIIISRLEETQKKISKAIEIWRELENKLEDWSLHICGTGSSEKLYKELANGLKRIYFEGRVEPKKFYKKASIFFMTSISEGWGLTLTESQQFGVIPIAYDTYASLHDIIKDGENGYIIPYDNKNTYSQKVLTLISNPDLRKSMAFNAISSSKRFKIKFIANKWIELFKSIQG